MNDRSIEHIEIGTQLGGYTLGERISNTPTGPVFLAVHRTTGMQVEIKVLPADAAANENDAARQRMRRELETLTSLKHKNIVRVWALAREGTTDFLVMEHIEGRTLADMLKLRGRLRISDAIRFHIRALEGLQAVHSSYVVHRDIHPGCLILAEDGRVVLGGFGLARFFNSNDLGQMGTVLNVEMMESGVFKAPEQLYSEVNPQSDIYAIGTCLYLSIAGELPFDGSPDIQILSRAEKPPIPLSSRMPGISEAVSTTVGHFLAMRPEDRYTSAQIAAKALARLI